MEAYYTGLTLIQKVFFICAIAGGTLFVIRTIMLLIGLGSDMDVGEDVHSGLADTDVSFHFLTIHGITAFFLIFGVTGMVVLKNHESQWLALGLGGVAGLLVMGMIAKIFSSMRRLQTEGNIRLENAIGQEGAVYLNIPPGGIGKVQLSIQGSLKIYEARSASRELIKTGDRVKVLEVTPENMLIVEKRVY
ncbi:MAG: hypothetical protein R6X19_05105 [Kiritimatiellia bacterium]